MPKNSNTTNSAKYALFGVQKQDKKKPRMMNNKIELA